MWLSFFIVSALINVVACFYIVWLLRTVAAINQDVENVSQIIRDFTQHVETVHELETFYGDETLGELMRHARALTESLSDLDLILNTEDQDFDEDKGDEIA